jgi:fimbrial isopeptide formation D2 family protein/uncharacterized repeat protein (TIGR01451 family)
MDIQHPHWTKRGTRVAHSLLSITLMLSMVLGGILGPWLLPPTQSQAAPLGQQPEAIDIGKIEESEFSPHLKASYGELITYTLVFTVGTGLHSGIIITDTFGNPQGAIFLPVTPTSSFGPYPISAGAPDPNDPVMNVYFPPSLPGRPVVHWDLDPINNTSGGNWVFGIDYRARIHTDNQVGNPTRKAHSTAVVDWDQGGPITDVAMDVTLLQPLNVSFNKAQQPPESTPLSAGAQITWTLSLRDQPGAGQGWAYDVFVTDTMPAGTISDVITVPPTATYVVYGNKVIFSIPVLPTSTHDTNLRIKAHLPATGNVAHGKVYNVADLYRSSAPGVAPGERTWISPAADSTTAYIKNITLGKSQKSSAVFNNSNHQSVAGEFVTVTVNIVVPQGTVIYDPRVRILLEDGLTITGVISDTPDYDVVTIVPGDQDPDRPTGSFWTQYQWSKLDSITDTATGPMTMTMYFRAQARQRYFLPYDPVAGQEVPHGNLLDIVPIVRWASQPGGPVENTTCSTSLCQRNVDSNPTVSVQFIRPDLRYASPTSGSYFTTSGPFQGGGEITFLLHLRNRTGSPPCPNAYDILLLENLSPELQFESADPPATVITGTAGTTLTWDVVPPISNNTDLFTVTASLPPTMVVGLVATNTAHARYSTFSGTVPQEGVYYDAPPADPAFTARTVIQGGFLLTKAVSPDDNVRIGDTVTYTVVLEVNKGMIMYLPTFEDKLPRGLHYVDGSLVVENGELTGTVFYTGTGSPSWQQKLSWDLETVDNQGGVSPVAVTIRYRAVVKGLDYRTGANGQPVWASSRNDMVNKQNANNAVNVCWRPSAEPGPVTDCLASPVSAQAKVVQPYLADSPPWNKVRTDPYNEYEVGDQVYFKVTLKNTGQGTAYDILLKDTLPRGVAIQDTTVTATPASPPVNLVAHPPISATGAISWTLNQIAPNQTVDLSYRTQVISTAIPGDHLTNLASIYDYSSMPDVVQYERHYKDFDGAFAQDPIPQPKSCTPFIILGVGLHKTDTPDPVEPGAVLTYTLTFSNSSGRFGATNGRITDTYDANLTYLGASKSSTLIQGPYFYPPRTVVWTIPFLPNNNPTEYWIKPFFQVVKPFDPADVPLVNQAGIDAQGDMTGPVWRTEETDLKMPALQIKKTGSPAYVQPGGTIYYTMRFTNTTTYNVTATSVLIQDTYDPYVNFVSASPTPNPGTNNKWDWQPLGQGDGGTIRVTVTVDIPVPAGVTEVVNKASISCDQVLSNWSPDLHTALQVPILNISTIDQPDPVEPGGALLYTIAFTNVGSLKATQPVLVNTLDSHVTFFDGDPDPVGNSCPNNICTWNLPDLNPSSWSHVRIYVTVDDTIPPGVNRLVNRVSLSALEVGPNTDIEYTALPFSGYYIFLPLIDRQASGNVIQ